MESLQQIPSRRPAGSRVLLIVPAFNEERNIVTVVQSAHHLGYDVCVVDDRSVDRTAASADGAGATVLRLPVNLGAGTAVRTGFLWALAHGYDTVVQVNANGQHDLEKIEVLLDVLDDTGAEMVIGSRFTDN